MDTDGQSCNIGNQDNPSSTAGLIHLALPFQNQPEHQGGQETGESIDFCLDCREPEGVAEGVGQCANHAACLSGDDLRNAHFPIADRANQFPGEVSHREKQEEYAARTQQCRQKIDHQRHMRLITGQL